MTTLLTTVEAAIHNRWSGITALVDLIPVSRFVTGPAQSEILPTPENEPDLIDSPDDNLPPTLPSLPCAKLTTQSQTVNWRSSDGRGDTTNIRIQVWCNGHAEGKLINQVIRAQYDDQSWVDSVLTVDCCRVDNQFELQEEDGVWQFVTDLEVRSKY